MDIGNICDLFGIWLVCLELSVQMILVLIYLLSQINPLPAMTNFGQQTIFFHDSKYGLGISHNISVF